MLLCSIWGTSRNRLEYAVELSAAGHKGGAKTDGNVKHYRTPPEIISARNCRTDRRVRLSQPGRNLFRFTKGDKVRGRSGRALGGNGIERVRIHGAVEEGVRLCRRSQNRHSGRICHRKRRNYRRKKHNFAQYPHSARNTWLRAGNRRLQWHRFHEKCPALFTSRAG